MIETSCINLWNSHEWNMTVDDLNISYPTIDHQQYSVSDYSISQHKRLMFYNITVDEYDQLNNQLNKTIHDGALSVCKGFFSMDVDKKEPHVWTERLPWTVWYPAGRNMLRYPGKLFVYIFELLDMFWPQKILAHVFVCFKDCKYTCSIYKYWTCLLA